MRVFVYEWTCCCPGAPLSLRREGWAMLRAVLDDFWRSGEVGTVTVIHEGFEQLPPGSVQRIRTAAEEEDQFRVLAGGADATLVIAPETANCLADRARWVEEAGGTLLGPASTAIGLATHKLLCGQWWQKHRVPTPAARWLGESGAFPAVLKPLDGAGSQATFLVRDEAALGPCLQQAESEAGRHEFILQDHVPGQAASVAFLIGPRETIALPPAAQLISSDGRFHYQGGTLPLPAPLSARAVSLGRRALAAIDGWQGYVGVDLVLGNAEDGSEDFAIEINPRLTASYLGLRMLCRDNIALAMLRVALGEDSGELRWREAASASASMAPPEYEPCLETAALGAYIPWMVKLLRRLVVLAALMLWQGGFTFYGAFVVPIGAEILGSHLDQGFITQRVTNRLNVIGAVALAILAWDVAVCPAGRRWRWASWGLLVASLCGLLWLHTSLDGLLDAEQQDILDPEAFRENHQLYLLVSTLQWVLALTSLAQALWAWRRQDAIQA